MQAKRIFKVPFKSSGIAWRSRRKIEIHHFCVLYRRCAAIYIGGYLRNHNQILKLCQTFKKLSTNEGKYLHKTNRAETFSFWISDCEIIMKSTIFQQLVKVLNVKLSWATNDSHACFQKEIASVNECKSKLLSMENVFSSSHPKYEIMIIITCCQPDV